MHINPTVVLAQQVVDLYVPEKLVIFPVSLILTYTRTYTHTPTHIHTYFSCTIIGACVCLPVGMYVSIANIYNYITYVYIYMCLLLLLEWRFLACSVHIVCVSTL